jgi:hypothetical protein
VPIKMMATMMLSSGVGGGVAATAAPARLRPPRAGPTPRQPQQRRRRPRGGGGGGGGDTAAAAATPAGSLKEEAAAGDDAPRGFGPLPLLDAGAAYSHVSPGVCDACAEGADARRAWVRGGGESNHPRTPRGRRGGDGTKEKTKTKIGFFFWIG